MIELYLCDDEKIFTNYIFNIYHGNEIKNTNFRVLS